MPANVPKPQSVNCDGKSATAWSPSTTYARPRYMASVPIVTASDGSPRRVISTPLRAPARAPMTRTAGMIISIAQPWFHR